MKALSVLILRYKKPEAREWKVPLNFSIGKTEIPVGLGMITLALFARATINVLTKKTATISGIAFTIVFFIYLPTRNGICSPRSLQLPRKKGRPSS